jgi:rubrerythrin
MMSKIPEDMSKIKGTMKETEILRVAIIAELDAVNLYEQLAAASTNFGTKKLLLDVAKEEKTHVGEFTARLMKMDGQQLGEMEKGRLEEEKVTK